MVVIDFHSHFGKSSKLINFQNKSGITIDDVVREQERIGINFSTAIPLPSSYPEDLQRSNDEVTSIQDKRLLPFVWLNPYFLRTHDKRGQDEAELVRIIKEKRVYGLKVHPVMDGYYPDPKLMGPVLEIARETRLPILWHTGWGALGDPEYVEDCAEIFPDVTLVIGHLVDTNSPRIAKRMENVYLETSYCASPRRLAGIVSQIGSERILFGSDLGVNYPRVQIVTVQESQMPDKDKENILGLNAARLLNIKT